MGSVLNVDGRLDEDEQFGIWFCMFSLEISTVLDFSVDMQTVELDIQMLYSNQFLN